MEPAPRRIAWISPPPEVCWLCKEPLDDPDEKSSWNGNPAHRDCVRAHLIQRDPAFHESGDEEESTDEGTDALDGVLNRDDDEGDLE
jgi:hypothetical protein